MKKIIGLVIAILFTVIVFYNIVDAQNNKLVKKEVADNREVSIFGITLGKSLNDIGLKECKIKNEEKFPDSKIILKTYEEVQENICWKSLSLTPDHKIHIIGLGEDSAASTFSCGECRSLTVLFLKEATHDELLAYPVAEIGMGFPYEMSDVFLNLVVKKFGKPNKTEKSTLQNKMGATFDNETYYWNVGKHKLVLRKRYTEVEAGYFTATHYDKWSKEASGYIKNITDAEKEF